MRLKQLSLLLPVLLPVLAINLTDLRKGAIDIHDLAGLRVPNFQDAQGRQFLFPWIHYLDNHHVMFPVGYLERLLVPLIEQVRDEKDDGALADDQVEMLQCAFDPRPAPLRPMKQNFPNDPQDVRRAAARRDEFSHVVGEEQCANSIVVLDG